ncbi:MAG TPA: N-acetyltransferase [Actinoplanes sp.]|jgi:GNAT superfamily N-acetyltransferase
MQTRGPLPIDPPGDGRATSRSDLGDRAGARVLRRGGPDDIRPVARLIATAYTPLDVSAWLVPDAAARTRIMTDYVTILVEHAWRYGQLWLVDGAGTVDAAAVWLHRIRPVPPRTTDLPALARVTAPWTGRFDELHAVLDLHQPGGPHHRLMFLAVRPGLHQTGLGTALLAHADRRLDYHRVPAYAVAGTAGSRDLLARHGYRVGDPVEAPDDGPPHWPMRRPPRRPPEPRRPSSSS